MTESIDPNPMALPLRWQRALLFPCAALAAAAIQPGLSLADPEPGRRLGGRGPEASLTDSQKQQLFQTRRAWELRSYDQRLAMLRQGQSCLQGATTLEAYRGCKQEQRQAWRALQAQGREVMNAERSKLGLQPMPERQGRPWGNGPRKG
jgi:hypothetical protein